MWVPYMGIHMQSSVHNPLVNMLFANVFLALCIALSGFLYVDAHDMTRGISYTLWVNDTELISKIFPTPIKPETFYEFMLTTAEIIPNKYNFTTILHPKYGHYITSIGGINENVANKYFWMFYDLNEEPNIDSPPSDTQLSKVGVDFVKVKRGDFYLFWYKHVDFKSTS